MPKKPTFPRSLNRLIVTPENPNSFSANARARRWAKLIDQFPEIDQMNVIDLGGTPQYWEQAPVRPAHITTVNLGRYPSTESVTAVEGDATDGQNPVMKQQYDLVVSNSLMEHVGGHLQRRRMADLVYRLAPFHWIQTPYRYFPVEPHWLFPGIQFLPFAARVWVTERWPLGHQHAASRPEAIELVNNVELMSKAQMKDYYPGSTIWTERYGGLPKSLVAIRS